MERRDFLATLGSLFASAPFLRSVHARAGGILKADVAVIGGGTGGFAAALGALRNGLRVILSEETDWVGGQLTQQAVPPDEHPWVEQFGTTRSYRSFRDSVRRFYQSWYPLSQSARGAPILNPGNCSVSRICHEPRVALAVLEQMLAPYVSSGQLTLLLEHEAVRADVGGDRVESVLLRDLSDGREIEIEAPYFLDGTETGELLPLAGVEYVTGAEARGATGELHGAPEYQPQNMQAITWCFAVEYREGENHTIDRPEEYEFWRQYTPNLTPPWPGKLLDWAYSHPHTLKPRVLGFDPRLDAPEPGLWRYRRLADPGNFASEAWPGVSLVNWPQNDYWLGSVIDVERQEREEHLRRAKQLSYSLLYWMQTEAPRPDEGPGWPGLRLRGDLTGTSHGLAKRPYIRESRRIRAEFTVLEQHVGKEARTQATGLSEEEVTAETFEDSIGVGSYRIDLHPSTGGDNYIDVSSLPFQIPLGALIPIRVENLIPAAKNIGTTHITNGCYRLHPVEWNVGESAGMLIAFCMERKVTPRQVRNQPGLLQDFQAYIQGQGIEIRWPDPLRSPR